jgi:hypothetical protein
MTLKECLAAIRAEKVVALPAGGAAEGGDEQNRPVKTAPCSGSANISPANTEDSASDRDIYPKKPEDFCDQREIYPRSTCISPSTPIKLVQSDIIFGEAQGDPKKSTHRIEEVGPLGEIRVDRGVLGVDRAKGLGEIGEKWAKRDGPVAEAPAERPRKPFFTAGGDLSIPFDSDPRYHWWKGGQSVKATTAELKAEQGLVAGGGVRVG